MPLPQTTWTCRWCKTVRGASVELVDVDGKLACSECGRIDPNASSAWQHVDVSERTGAIVDRNEGILTDQMYRMNPGDFRVKVFEVSY